MRLSADDSLLLMVDFQAGLLPAIEDADAAVQEAGWLGGVAGELGVPIWLTEQAPEKIGHSVSALTERLGEHRVWEKRHFGVMEEPDFRRALEATKRRQIVICGAEAHICVLQSALGLLEAGYELYWLVDASVSRRRQEASLALARLQGHGGIGVSADMVAYEWLYRCDGELFSRVHRHFLKPRAGREVRFFSADSRPA